MNVFLRGVLSGDSEALLRWRNDPETWRNSINSVEVSPEEHARWFAEMLAVYSNESSSLRLTAFPSGLFASIGIRR